MFYIDVIGAGAIGGALVVLLSDYFKEHCKIRVYDENIDNLNDIEDAPHIEKLPKYQLHNNSSIVICCSSWQSTKDILLYLYRCRFKGYCFSISRDISNETSKLKNLLKTSQIKAIMPVGLEPGLLELLVERQISKFETIDSIITYCGGIVTKRPKNPLGYKRLFGKTYLPFNSKHAYKISAGRLIKVPRFSEILPYYWENIGWLESFHDGMQPLCNVNIKLKNADIEQRTLRWPEYAKGVLLLNELGLMDNNKQNGLSKKELMEQLLEKIFRRSDKDHSKTLLAIDMMHEEQKSQLKIEFNDYSSNINSMALATCLPIIYLIKALQDIDIKNGINDLIDLFSNQHIEKMLAFITKFNVQVTEYDI